MRSDRTLYNYPGYRSAHPGYAVVPLCRCPVIEGRTRFPDLGVPRVIEKNDVEIGLGVEQRFESLAPLSGHFLAVSLIIRQQAEHHAAGFIVVANAREVGSGYGGAETEQ